MPGKKVLLIKTYLVLLFIAASKITNIRLMRKLNSQKTFIFTASELEI